MIPKTFAYEYLNFLLFPKCFSTKQKTFKKRQNSTIKCSPQESCTRNHTAKTVRKSFFASTSNHHFNFFLMFNVLCNPEYTS